jgi:flagellar protein FliS
MMRSNPWNSYRQVAAQTATPGNLVLMLYDGAIRFLEQARQGFTLTDPLEYNLTINNSVQRAQAIINELDCALNTREGGDLANTLRGLYGYFDRRLTESNFKKDVHGIIEIIKRLTVLRDAWAQMLTQGSFEPEMAESSGMLSAVG